MHLGLMLSYWKLFQFVRYQAGHFSWEDESCKGCSKFSTDNKNVTLVKAKIDEDPMIECQDGY